MRTLRAPVAAAITTCVLVGTTAGATAAAVDDAISYTSAPTGWRSSSTTWPTLATR